MPGKGELRGSVASGSVAGELGRSIFPQKACFHGVLSCLGRLAGARAQKEMFRIVEAAGAARLLSWLWPRAWVQKLF